MLIEHVLEYFRAHRVEREYINKRHGRLTVMRFVRLKISRVTRSRSQILIPHARARLSIPKKIHCDNVFRFIAYNAQIVSKVHECPLEGERGFFFQIIIKIADVPFADRRYASAVHTKTAVPPDFFIFSRASKLIISHFT